MAKKVNPCSMPMLTNLRNILATLCVALVNLCVALVSISIELVGMILFFVGSILSLVITSVRGLWGILPFPSLPLSYSVMVAYFDDREEAKRAARLAERCEELGINPEDLS